MTEPPEQPMVEVVLGRIVIRESSDRQYIILQERGGKRGFPIVIGSNEAAEIKRVVAQIECERPLTHQLAFSIIEAFGARIRRCDIVDLRQNTFFAQLVLQTDSGGTAEWDGADRAAMLRIGDGPETLQAAVTQVLDTRPSPAPRAMPGPADQTRRFLDLVKPLV